MPTKGQAALTSAQLQAARLEAQKTRSIVHKAVKALALLIYGFSAIFLLSILRVLRKRNSGKISQAEARNQIDEIKAKWLVRSVDAIDKGWSTGIKLGQQSVRRQGVKPASNSISFDVLDSIKEDVKRAIDDADNLLSGLTQGQDAEKINKSILLRLQMSGEAALKFAVAATAESELASPDTMKMWLATSKVPCSHCQRLNGMTREWGEEFPHSFPGIHKLKVYGGILLGPLRHPNCLCVLIAVPKEKTNA